MSCLYKSEMPDQPTTDWWRRLRAINSAPRCCLQSSDAPSARTKINRGISEWLITSASNSIYCGSYWRGCNFLIIFSALLCHMSAVITWTQHSYNALYSHKGHRLAGRGSQTRVWRWMSLCQASKRLTRQLELLTLSLDVAGLHMAAAAATK